MDRTSSTMTAKQYKAARLKIGLANYSLAPVIGVSLRSAQRYESGELPVPATVAKLLRVMVRYELKPADLD